MTGSRLSAAAACPIHSTPSVPPVCVRARQLPPRTLSPNPYVEKLPPRKRPFWCSELGWMTHLQAV